ncbi:hypothetical protein Lepto7376_0368 [[Leptolyngbya] sp. PCC 7376]|uniref:hypothetical protein n=1 Tax=[Leptolyngbya] sp. PCC 7376 TaxID=111781 RepID=UPI00029F0DCE|nr:hypothetical protein [[Leptolyngbya] sp. PCC 7376]AFY36806.1 hypothetical protein Lepto7376_0368 [[Leptolyngbya] sp. PCC 7376]
MLKLRKFFSFLLVAVALSVGIGISFKLPQISAQTNISRQSQILVFGQKIYTRENGKPRTIIENFSVADTEALFTFVATNPQGKRGKVTSAVIKLNGVEILSPRELNQNVEVVSKRVSLQQNNQLEVQLRDKPGSALGVQISTPALPPPIGSAFIRVQPSTIPLNTSTRVQFSYQFPISSDSPDPVVELQRLDGDTGAVIASEGFLRDNGQLSLGDDIRNDGSFSFRKTYNFSTGTAIWLRTKVTVDSKTYYSEPNSLIARDLSPITPEQTQAIIDASNEGRELYKELLSIKGEAAAHNETVAYLNSLDIVEIAASQYTDGSNGEPKTYGINIRFVTGMNGFISTAPRGTRGGSKYDLKINRY